MQKNPLLYIWTLDFDRYQSQTINQLAKPQLQFRDLCFTYKGTISKCSLFQETTHRGDKLRRSSSANNTPDLTNAE